MLFAKDTAISIGRPSCITSKPGGSIFPDEEWFLYSTKRYTPYPIIPSPTRVNKKFKSFSKHSKHPLHAIL